MLTSVERAVRSLKCTKQSRINILCFFFFTGKRPNAKSQMQDTNNWAHKSIYLHTTTLVVLAAASTTQIYYSFTWFFSSTNHNGSNYIFRTAQCFCINFHSDALVNQNVPYKLCCYKILNQFDSNTLLILYLFGRTLRTNSNKIF